MPGEPGATSDPARRDAASENEVPAAEPDLLEVWAGEAKRVRRRRALRKTADVSEKVLAVTAQVVVEVISNLQ